MILYVGYNLKNIDNKSFLQSIDSYKVSTQKIINFNYVLKLEIFNDIVIVFEKGFSSEKEKSCLKQYKDMESEVLISMVNCPFYYFLSKDYKKELFCRGHYTNLNFVITYDELLEMQNTIKDFRKYFSKFRWYKDIENRNLETIRESIRNNKLFFFKIFSQLFKLTRKIIIEINKNKIF